MDPGLYEFSSYGAVLFFFLASIGLTVGMIMANRIVGAKSNPNPDKIESYECGEEPIGSAWLRFNIRFYMVALVFVIFDVELALVFPIAAVLKDTVTTTTHPGAFVNPTALMVAAELLIFVVILFLGLVYLWKKNDLGWNRVYRENADIEELVQQRLAHLPPVKIRPRPVAAAVVAPKAAAPAPVTVAAAAAPVAGAGAAKPGMPAALLAKLAAAKAAAGGTGAAAGGAAPAAPAAPTVPAAEPAAKPGIPAALAAKLAAAKAAAASGGTAGPAAAAPVAEAAPVAPATPAVPAVPAGPAAAGGIPPALAAKLAAAKAKAAGQNPPAEGGGAA